MEKLEQKKRISYYTISVCLIIDVVYAISRLITKDKCTAWVCLEFYMIEYFFWYFTHLSLLMKKNILQKWVQNEMKNENLTMSQISPYKPKMQHLVYITMFGHIFKGMHMSCKRKLSILHLRFFVWLRSYNSAFLYYFNGRGFYKLCSLHMYVHV